MRIQIVSYKSNIPWEIQDELNCRLFNQSKAEIILFPGWSFIDTNQLENFRNSITNDKTFAIMELKRMDSREITNCLYNVKAGQIKFSSLQYFATSDEINDNIELGRAFVSQFESAKTFHVQRNVVRVMQCGELNILRNEQSSNNKVNFRFSEDKLLNSEFKSILNSTDIILNPQHSPMGNQGKMSRRREYLSSNGRVYISTTNTDSNSIGFNNKSINYAYQNGKAIKTEIVEQAKYHAVFECQI